MDHLLVGEEEEQAGGPRWHNLHWYLNCSDPIFGFGQVIYDLPLHGLKWGNGGVDSLTNGCFKTFHELMEV